MSVLIITQARYGSSRLPGKVLKKIGDETTLGIHLERLKKSQKAKDVLVATTNESHASHIIKLAESYGCLYYQGDLHDVLDRYYQAALTLQPKIVVRVTSDCPLIDHKVIDQMIGIFQESEIDYLSNVHPPTYPDGIDVEVFTFKALEKSWKEAKEKKEREHVTPYIWSNPEIFKIQNFSYHTDKSMHRLTIDTQEDFELISHLVKVLGKKLDWEEYVDYLMLNPEVMKINSSHKRNEGY
jgi:spore coat polysaccharide biosynthesis protein SpsF